MLRRVLIGLLALVNVLVGAYGGYALYTRVGGPSFSRGGAFGAPDPVSSTSASARPGTTTVKGTHITASSARATPGARSTSQPRPGARAGKSAPRGFPVPKAGTYALAQSGHEQVKFGAASACSWDLKDGTLTVKHSDEGPVFDWDYAAQHQERLIYAYEPDGVYTTYVGAAVTCVGMRQTSDTSYEPRGLDITFPPKIGYTWKQTLKAGERIEKITGKIASFKKVTVPAGTFDTYELRMSATVSGSETGTYSGTRWFAPALGMYVKLVNHTDINSGSAKFTADTTIALASLPG